MGDRKNMTLPEQLFRQMIGKLVPEKNWRLLKWKFCKTRIDRNSWLTKNGASWETYKNEMEWSWDETKSNAPQYFKRLEFTVKHCRGRVLEIGGGIGTMTRWIAESEDVVEVVAIDAFSEAIEEMKRYNIAKVTPLQMNLEDIKCEDGRKFDTVVNCEVIEHIYPDEEEKMLISLKPYIDSHTLFILSTPIGWLQDPFHVRAFSEKEFKKHIRKYYGNPIGIDTSSGYSQVAIGYFEG